VQPRFVGRRLTIAIQGSAIVALVLAVNCAPAIKSTIAGPPTRAQLAQLWVEPDRDRDLFWGVGGKRLAPDPDEAYRVIEVKRDGFSDGYTVVDSEKREWSAKFRPEALTEVVASRILWGIGYHQPPIYLLEKWTASGAVTANPQLSARFREKTPDLHGLDAVGDWSYYQNPFVGTRQLKGLLVLQAMLGNSDLKPGNNALYELAQPFEGADRWFVSRDLGHTFGRMGLIDAPRGDIEAFETTPFIKSVDDGTVQLQLGGRHDALFADILPEDVIWICERLDRLTDRQWDDAFRAGGYDKPTADRFIRRLKQKIAEGLALGR
jgi:hypothetical protein